MIVTMTSSSLLKSPYKKPATALLSLLSDEDLTGLVKTVSGGKILPTTKQGNLLLRIKEILNYNLKVYTDM